MKDLAERARAVLAANDMGSFVRPGRDLYPHQWNWDSAFVAIGLAYVDPVRGRAEVRSLLKGQWKDGMVPHIVFHVPAPDYAPGPELWDSAACEHAPELPTSGLTQPPVLATAVRILHEASPDLSFLEDVVPAIERWHAWLHAERAVESGLIAIVHPWEGADNSPRFDRALQRLQVGGELGMERTDHHAVDATERPTDSDYVRYLYLVRQLQAESYRPTLQDTPFVFVDLTFNSILAVAEADLAWLWGELGSNGARASAASRHLVDALAERWDESRAVYLEDSGDDTPGDETVDALFPLYAGVPGADQARRLYDEALWSPTRFGPSPDAPWAVTSTSKSSSAFEPRRYWRGPVWVNVNWFFIRALERYGLQAEADELTRMTLELVRRSDFVEYYDPRTGEPLGATEFSWSAALTLDLLLHT